MELEKRRSPSSQVERLKGWKQIAEFLVSLSRLLSGGPRKGCRSVERADL